ncbi:MAG TPA: hypothetical protein ACHBX0_02715 [Arsenophonus sp.]
MLTTLLAPYPQLEIMPTSGISPVNIRQYLALPKVVA